MQEEVDLSRLLSIGWMSMCQGWDRGPLQGTVIPQRPPGPFLGAQHQWWVVETPSYSITHPQACWVQPDCPHVWSHQSPGSRGLSSLTQSLLQSIWKWCCSYCFSTEKNQFLLHISTTEKSGEMYSLGQIPDKRLSFFSKGAKVKKNEWT